MDAKEVIKQLVDCLGSMAVIVELEVDNAQEYCAREFEATTKALKDASEYLKNH